MKPKVFGEIIEGIEYQERHAVYGLLFDNFNRIGIIKTPRGNFLPGGGIENEETHIQCLQREFLEETGYRISVGDFLGCGILYGFAPSPAYRKYLKMIGYFYKVKFIEISKDKIEDDHELIWLDAVDAEGKMKLEHQAWAIRLKYQKENNL